MSAFSGKLDIVGVAEVAEMAGVTRFVVAQWVKRGKLPEPAAVLKGGKVWHRRDIQAWLDSRFVAEHVVIVSVP